MYAFFCLFARLLFTYLFIISSNLKQLSKMKNTSLCYFKLLGQQWNRLMAKNFQSKHD